MGANGYETHGDSLDFNVRELACLLTGVNFLPDTDDATNRIIRHLTNGAVSAADTQFPGYLATYPGATHSLQDMLHQAITLQHPNLTEFSPLARAFPNAKAAAAWLSGKARLLGYATPEVELSVAPLDHVNIRVETVLVVHCGSNTDPSAVITVSGENIDAHEADPRFGSARPFGCLYYLQTLSVWDGSSFGLLAKPGTCYPYTNTATGQPYHETGPFANEWPPITAQTLRVPASVPQQRAMPRHRQD